MAKDISIRRRNRYNLDQRIKTKLSQTRGFENNRTSHQPKYPKQYNSKTRMENSERH
jgi:hypothetical protein